VQAYATILELCRYQPKCAPSATVYNINLGKIMSRTKAAIVKRLQIYLRFAFLLNIFTYILGTHGG